MVSAVPRSCQPFHLHDIQIVIRIINRQLVYCTWWWCPAPLGDRVGDRQLRRHHLRRRTELRWFSRRVSYRCALQRLHLQGPQTLLPQPLLAPPLQFTLHKAAEAANHHDQGPNQPESSKARQESVGTLGHHHDCADPGERTRTSAVQPRKPKVSYFAEIPHSSLTLAHLRIIFSFNR